MKTNGKKKTRKNNLRTRMSSQTRWAYWMKAIEPKSEAINKAFPDYHPQWVCNSQMMTIAPENFALMRLSMGMNVEQCAAYLRVTAQTIRLWENKGSTVPFMAFELMRLVIESVQFKLSHAAWDGWFISRNGALVSPDIGGQGFTPEQLVWSSMNRNEAALLRNEVAQLKTELGDARSENTKLRQMFVSHGVVDELSAMQDTINDLMARIATAKVIPFQISKEQKQEKVA